MFLQECVAFQVILPIKTGRFARGGQCIAKNTAVLFLAQKVKSNRLDQSDFSKNSHPRVTVTNAVRVSRFGEINTGRSNRPRMCAVRSCSRCEFDGVTPKSTAEKTEKRLGEYAEVINYPIAHFDIYHLDYFEKAFGDQLNFLRKRL
jgi:hypothetical protein